MTANGSTSAPSPASRRSKVLNWPDWLPEQKCGASHALRSFPQALKWVVEGWKCLEGPSQVGWPEMESLKGGVGVDWGSFLVVGVPDGNGFSGGWNTAMGNIEKWLLIKKIFNWPPGWSSFYIISWGRKKNKLHLGNWLGWENNWALACWQPQASWLPVVTIHQKPARRFRTAGLGHTLH